MKKHKHKFHYMGGQAKCTCGMYLQPDGTITKTVTGRKRAKTRTKKVNRRK